VWGLPVGFKNSEYKVHQVDTKDSDGQNFSFLAFKATFVASIQISPNNGGDDATAATARDRRKFYYRSNIYPLKVLKNENQQKKFHFS
jgi:hypothetical protein